MIQHHNPRTKLIAERYKFNSRVRNVNDSISTYMAELYKLTEHCGHGKILSAEKNTTFSSDFLV